MTRGKFLQILQKSKKWNLKQFRHQCNSVWILYELFIKLQHIDKMSLYMYLTLCKRLCPHLFKREYLWKSYDFQWHRKMEWDLNDSLNIYFTSIGKQVLTTCINLWLCFLGTTPVVAPSWQLLLGIKLGTLMIARPTLYLTTPDITRIFLFFNIM